MNISQYLDATFLKTEKSHGLDTVTIQNEIDKLVEDAVTYNCKAVMVRPEWVAYCKNLLDKKESNVLVGTVIGFPEGTYTEEEKISEARLAIDNGADELDFVLNYPAFLNGKYDVIQSEFKSCTEVSINNEKTIKWIIETAALTEKQTEELCLLISQWALPFEGKYNQIFVKSSTGFFITENNAPNGATPDKIKIMLEACPLLPIKASGGISDLHTAEKYIQMGVKRLGTSSHTKICQEYLAKSKSE